MKSCAKSTAGRARRTSLSAISSPACGSYPSLIGRSSSKASVWSTRSYGRAVISPTWISRRATGIAALSKSLRAVRLTRKSMSPGQPFSLQNALEADQQAGTAEPDPRPRDPGYYLIGQGRRAFETETWLSRSAEGLAGPRERGGGNFRLSRDCRVRCRATSRTGIACGQCGRHRWMGSPATGVPGILHFRRCRNHAGEPRGHGSVRPRRAPRTRASRRCFE